MRLPILLASLSLTVSALAAPSFQVTNLGTLGGNLSAATSIASTGQIAGYATPSFGSSRAFSYSGGVMTNLLPSTGRWSYGYGINASGQIVGHYNTLITNPSFDTAFVTSDGTATAIPTLGGQNGYAIAINASGQVVGNSFLSGNSTRHAYLYSGGTVTDLTPSIGARNSYARAINDSGWIAGSYERTNATDEIAFRWNGLSMQTFLLGGTRSHAYGINSTGHVVGQSTVTGSSDTRAFLFNGESVVNLGSLGGSSSTAYGINDSGWIVGSSFSADNTEILATLHELGTLYDLNSLIPSGSGWVLREALAVNGSGLIVGYGEFQGSQRAFLLTPVPEPAHAAALIGLAGVLASFLRRRKA